MSDSKKAAPRDVTVTLRDFMRFSDAKNLHSDCTCGENRWALALMDGYKEGDQDALLQLAGISGMGLSGSLPVHPMMCLSCGTMKMVSAMIVKDWVKTHE